MLTHTQLKIFFVSLLISLTTVTVLAQVTSAGQSKNRSVVAAQPGVGTSAQMRGAAPSRAGSVENALVGFPSLQFDPGAMDPGRLFLPVVTYDSGGQSFSVAIADLNGDGKLDLVVTNAGLAEGVIGVLLGKGDGTFLPVVTYNSGGDLAYSVAVADVNGDGKPDLLVADCGLIGINVCNHSNGLVGVLLGNGDGTFQPVVTYDSGGSTTVSIAVADVNADGKPDVLVANECDNSSTCADGSVGVLLGNGDGTFQAAKIYDAGFAIHSLAVADVNRDGKLDLLVAKGGTNNNVGVLLGNGDGTFQPVINYDSGGNTAMSVVVADVNGDGKPDLLVGNLCNMSNNCADGSVGVLLGNGDGTFQPVVNYGSGGTGVSALAVADVNGDGKRDLLDVSFSHNTVGVLIGNGDGTFQGVTTYDPGGILPQSIAIADLNGDGKPDVAVANFCGSSPNCLPGKLGVLLNNTAVKSSTSTTLTSTLNPSTYGQKVTWTAKVTSSGSVMPTGTVSLKWQYFTETFTIGSATLNSSGVATLTKSNLNADTYPLTAVYSGDAANLGSTSAVLNQVVLEATSTATLTSSPNPSAQGQAVTFTAKITSPTVIPAGPVTFTAGKTVLGTAQLSGGKATLTISSLAVGSTQVTATYYGDSNIAKSSASVIQTVH